MLLFEQLGLVGGSDKYLNIFISSLGYLQSVQSHNAKQIKFTLKADIVDLVRMLASLHKLS